jgi:uncharacterized membrane protein (DUF2068 family)
VDDNAGGLTPHVDVRERRRLVDQAHLQGVILRPLYHGHRVIVAGFQGDLGGAAQTQSSELDVTQELNEAINALEVFKAFVESAILQASGLSIVAGIAAIQIAARASEGRKLVSERSWVWQAAPNLAA